MRSAFSSALSASGTVTKWYGDGPRQNQTAPLNSSSISAGNPAAASRVKERAALAGALYDLAFPKVQSRDYDEGERLARRSEGPYAELGDAHGVARALWLRSPPGHAEDLLRRAISTSRHP